MKNKRAFTLIELLVVIGIIAILAALLLPVLNKARDTAHKIRCASSTSQIGSVLQSYRNDNDEYLPLSQDLGTGDKWFNYLTNRNRYLPLDNFKKLTNCQGKPIRTYQYVYGVNSKLMGRRNADGSFANYGRIKCIKLKKPSMTFMTMDGRTLFGAIDSKAGTDPSNIAGCQTEFPHLGGTNIGYIDGHVAWSKMRLGGFTASEIAMTSTILLYE